MSKKLGGAMVKKRAATVLISPELFVKTWQEGSSVKDIARILGIKTVNASARAANLRRRLGIPLKRYHAEYGPNRVAALKKLAEDLSKKP